MITIIIETKYKNTNIIFIGIVHNSPISYRRVKEVLDKYNKTPVLIEYCNRRFKANILKKRHSFWDIIAKTEVFIEEYTIKRCLKEKRQIKFIDIDVKETLKEKYNMLTLIFDFIRKLFYTPTFEVHEQEIIYFENLHYEQIPKNLDPKRDKYMSMKIKNFIENNNPNEIIIIIGKGHLPGIINNLQY